MSLKLKPIALILLLHFSVNAIGQNKVGYGYDNNGNRTQRFFIGFRMANPNPQPQDSIIKPNTLASDSVHQPKPEREIAMAHGITVYPNPTKDQIMVIIHKAGISETEKATVYLTDNSGKNLDTKNYTGSEIGFDLGKTPPGEYYLTVIFENKEKLSYSVIKVD